ncbi:MAG: hypothetical protein WBM13_12810 [Bacteroidia bacterium]
MISLILLPCFKQKDLHEVFIAIFTSAAFGLLIEISILSRDYFHLGYLAGTYKRIKFYNRNGQTSGIGYDDGTDEYKRQEINNEIKLVYKGQGEYKGFAFYPRGKKHFTLTLNPNNILSGSGIYQYESKDPDKITPDIGIFEFTVDMDKKSIYIEHKNRLPSGNAMGMEIWSKLAYA